MTCTDCMSDEELYREYQKAKTVGSVQRIDELQLEIAQRWEEMVEDRHVDAENASGYLHFDPEEWEREVFGE